MSGRHKWAMVTLGFMALTGWQARCLARSSDLDSSRAMRLNHGASIAVSLSEDTDALILDWGQNGSTVALTGLTGTSTSLQLGLSDVGREHVVKTGSQQLDLTALANAPTIVADTTVTGSFTISHSESLVIEDFSSFSSFVDRLATDVNGTTAVIAVSATGTYNTSINTLTANSILIVLKS
jgi:hypothetical protein